MGYSRRFNSRERVALWLAAGGKCSSCGVYLGPGWHADHVVPWSAGGSTDPINGQALCVTCNLKKGYRMLRPWPSSRALRIWQQRAFNKFLTSSKANFLCVAAPGAGKSFFALRAAHELLATGRAKRIVIVVPTEHLKIQWAKEAAKVGIELTPEFSNSDGSFAVDFRGAVVTYAQVASQPDLIRRICGEVPTFAIVDEIHHAGQNRSWGDGLLRALDVCVRRLLLSGTPFRPDNNPIPFVEYDLEGLCVASFTYSYADALGDGVCRPILFPSYEGEMKWYARGKKFEHTFRDEISDSLSAQRLRTALDPNGQWIREVIRDADAKLTLVREGHSDAGGLCLAMDKMHAEDLVPIFLELTGARPLIVTYDNKDASDLIEEYARSTHRWVVAIRMISEGVDIRRLRVGIYATNILTELFFRQATGRTGRTIDGIEDQNAYWYVPRDPTLIGHVLKIKEERAHQLEQECREALDRQPSDPDAPPIDDKMLRLFMAVSSTGKPDDVYSDGEAVSQVEIREAEGFRSAIGMPYSYDPTYLAKLIRMARGTTVTAFAQAEVVATPIPEPLHVQKRHLRRLIKRLVATLKEMSDGSLEYSDIFTRLMKRDGVSQDQATIDQLKGRIEHLEQWIRSYPDVR